MSSQFKYLFTPIEIGPITVRNRIYAPPMQTNYASDIVGYPSETLAYYHGERAKGGTGLTIVEASLIHPKAEYFPLKMLNLYDEKNIPGLKKIADEVHKYDGRVIVELNHPGANAAPVVSRLASVSCSPIPGVANGVTPHELEVEEIEEIVDAFGKSAKNCITAGMDGVELHGTHGYLINEFNSPLFNKRTDKYGGSLENRMRFMTEILDRIQEYAGTNFILGVRMDVDELMEGGITPEIGKQMAQRLEVAGKVNFLDIDGTTYHLLHIMIGPMYIPPANLIYTAAAIKEAVKKTPVGGVGRINDVVLAEKLLAEGKADMIGFARQHLADPELANKARAGRLEDIRACIGCNQLCVGNLFVGLPIACVQNPIINREKEWGAGSIKPAERKKKVVIVGGGPAGMEAARVAALRGHDVTLYEKEKELGGQVNLAAKLPGRDEFGGAARWLKTQIQKLPVKVVLGVEATVELVKKEKPDAVVIATGATPLRSGLQGLTGLPIPGANQANVATAEDIIAGRVRAGNTVVILDEDGGITPPGVAEMLAAEGRKVEVLTRWPHVGMNLFTNLHLPVVYERIMRLGVTMTPNTFIKQIDGSSVVAFNVYTGEERRIEGVDTVILVTGKESNVSLYRQLKGQVPELHIIGDCVAPRLLDSAVFDGHKIGRLL
ncbi:MAG: FAD-dependent oxidoreductase [Candidatus Bathyarchaeia archaeon]